MWLSLRLSILPVGTASQGRLGPRVDLAVRVAWSLAAGYPPAAALPRRRGAADLHPPDRSVAELAVKPPDEHRGEQPDLRRPGGRIGRHRELAVVEAVGAGVRRQVVTDDFRPAAEHRAHRRPLLPAPRVEQASDRADQRLRVFPAGAPASGPGPAGTRPASRAGARSRPGRVILAGRGHAGPFGINGLAGPRLARQAGRQIAPGPRVRLGHGERLDRQPHPIRVGRPGGRTLRRHRRPRPRGR